MENTRRGFLKKALLGTTAVTFGGVLPGFSAKSYGSIMGANDRLPVAVMGVNSRGGGLARNFAQQPNCEVLYVSDVDSRAADKCIANVEKFQKNKPKAAPDFRRTLEDKKVDALVVAAPDHWHAPAAIMACKAGMHVFLEKPASHNPHEGELLLAAVAKYKRLIQMGNQRRSWHHVISAINELRQGAIGRPYFAKTWYTSNRQSIGKGQVTQVPSWLDYDLWQGPAPRQPYRDNLVHYNWHWFWHWGTAESMNNGTHMLDLARWGLGVEYPTRVTSAGGRYHFQDDQETPDTQVITLEFGNKSSIVWEGRSCNGQVVDGSSVGVQFYGESGSLLMDGSNGYTIYDAKNTVVKEVKSNTAVNAQDRANPSQGLDAVHIHNFLEAIRLGTPLTSDIQSGHKSTLLGQLGNIALRSGYTLNLNPENGRILNNPEAQKYWSRTYEPGWEPTV